MGREIAVGFWSDVTRAIFGAVETSPYNVADDIVAAISLQSERPEWRFLQNEFDFITRNMAQAAVPANFSGVGIVNRSSGTLVVITGFQNPQGAAQSVIFRRGRLPDAVFEAAVNTEVPAIPLDLRVPGTPDASLAAREFTSDSVAGVGSTPFGIAAPGQTYPPVPYGSRNPVLAVLPPNSYLVAESTIVNTVASGLFFGYTRPLFSGNRA